MKVIEKEKPTTASKTGEYASLDELILTKMKRASKTLKGVDLKKTQPVNRAN